MDGLKLFFAIMLSIILFVPLIVAELDQSERAYFDGQNQKIVAQLSSKIDTQTNRVEADLKSEVESAKNKIKEELSKEISGSLKAISIGLAGMIIITLSIFKIVDLQLSKTRAIKKYEDELKDKTNKINQLIQDVQIERQQLQNARQQLVEYQIKLQNWETNLRQKKSEISSSQSVNKNVFLIPNEKKSLETPVFIPQMPKKEKKINFKKILIGFLILIVISGIISLIYKFLILR